MKNPFKRNAAESLSEDVQLQEIDERHFLSQQIFYRRYERGWSQERLAEEGGLTQAQVATLEAGQANPTLRTVVKLAAAFGCSVRDLMTPGDNEVDGCTQADREAAEVLRELARHAQWGEDHPNAEFLLAPASGASARTGSNVFHVQAAKRLARSGRASVSLDLSQAGNNMEAGEYTQAAEL